MRREEFDKALLSAMILSLLLLVNRIELFISIIIIVMSYILGQAWIGKQEREKRNREELGN